MNPFLSPSKKLYKDAKKVKRTQEMRTGVPKYDEITAHAGMLIHRAMIAFRREIRPEGMGRQGLFSASSSGRTVWLMRLNCNRTDHSQKMAMRAFSIGCERHTGAVPRAKMV